MPEPLTLIWTWEDLKSALIDQGCSPLPSDAAIQTQFANLYWGFKEAMIQEGNTVLQDLAQCPDLAE